MITQAYRINRYRDTYREPIPSGVAILASMWRCYTITLALACLCAALAKAGV